MNKLVFSTCILFILLPQALAGKKPATYTVAGGRVEVYDTRSSSWKKIPRNKSVRSTDFVRSNESFMLRNSNGFSHSYNQCDCTLVSKLSPAKMSRTVSRDNDVVSRIHAISIPIAPALAQKLESEGWKPYGTSSVKESLDSISTRTSANPRKYLLMEGNGSGSDSDSAVKTAEKDAACGIDLKPTFEMSLIRPATGERTEARVYLLFEIE